MRGLRLLRKRSSTGFYFFEQLTLQSCELHSLFAENSSNRGQWLVEN